MNVLEGIRGRLRVAALSNYLTVCWLLAFACACLLIFDRVLADFAVHDPTHLDRSGLLDFRETIYDPVRVFLTGGNPYTVRYASLGGGVFWMYSPLALLLYAPFGLFRFENAAIVFLTLNLALVPVLAWLVLRMFDVTATVGRVFGLATLIAVSRGGYVTLFLGQSTVYLTLATYAALHFARKRPWLAGFALAVATVKPTFGGPLAILMLAMRQQRSVLIGFAIAIVGAAVPGTVLMYELGGPRPFLASMATAYTGFKAMSVNNVASAPLRVDAAALLGRLINPSAAARAEFAVTLAILALGAIALRRLATSESDRDRRVSATSVSLAMLTCIYQQVYGLVLLTLPLTLVSRRWGPRTEAFEALRWSLLVLMTIPVTNYFMSRRALEFFGISNLQILNGWVLALASVNGAALFAAFSLCVAFALLGARFPTAAVGERTTYGYRQPI